MNEMVDKHVLQGCTFGELSNTTNRDGGHVNALEHNGIRRDAHLVSSPILQIGMVVMSLHLSTMGSAALENSGCASCRMGGTGTIPTWASRANTKHVTLLVLCSEHPFGEGLNRSPNYICKVLGCNCICPVTKGGGGLLGGEDSRDLCIDVKQRAGGPVLIGYYHVLWQPLWRWRWHHGNHP
jgi:hypothetical protein